MKVIFKNNKPAASIAQLEAIEQQLAVSLPDEYRQFLTTTNGGKPKPACFAIHWTPDQRAKHWDSGEVDYFLSVYDDEYSSFDDYLSTYEGRIPSDTVAIGYDAGANLILIGIGPANYGKIFFWMHSYENDNADYSNVGFVSNTFNEFLDLLYDE